MKNKYSIKKISTYAVIFAIIIVFLIPTLYTMPSIDDYDYANQIINGPMASGNTIFKSILLAIKNTYIKWQGNYFSFFVLYTYAAIGGLSLWWVRITVAVNVLLFFISVLFLINIFIKDNKYEPQTIFMGIVFALIVFCGLNRASPSEALYWLNASCIYTLPFTMSFFSIGNTELYIRKKQKKNLIAAVIFSVLAAGGILMATAFINICSLILVLNNYVIRKNKDKSILVFLLAFIGGVVNALAPGNFVRAQGVASEGISIISAIKNTAIVFGDQVIYSLRKEYLLWACILIFIVVLFFLEYDKETIFNPSIFWLEGLIILFVTAFPVIYGYNSTEIRPWRFCFIYEFLIASIFIICSINTAFYIKKHLHYKESKIAKIIVSILVIFFLGINYKVSGKEDMMLLNLGREIANGSLKNFSLQEEQYINEIETTLEDDVILYGENPTSSILKDFNLKDDSSDSVNIHMASYYHKNTIILKKE